MSQYLLPTIDAAVNDGIDLVSFLNQWKEAVLTNNSGAARPTYAVRGTIWIKETSQEDSIYYFTGTDDVLLFLIDRASGTIISGGGGGSTGAINFKGALDPTAAAPIAQSGDYYISNTSGTIDNSFVGIAGETGAATDVLIYDGSFWSRIANTIDLSAYMPLAGGTMTGPLLLSQNPVDDMEAATRQWVLSLGTGSSLPLAGGVLTGPLELAGDPSAPLEAATKQYVDAGDALAVPLAGGVMTGPLLLSGAPVGANNAATKSYVDNFHDASKLNVSGGTLSGPLLLAGNAAAPLEPVPLVQYQAGIESVQVSTGSPSGNKLVRTNAVGKIDNSLLTISTGFNYGGQIDPENTAPANINGNYYILNADGVFDASFGAPLAGTSGNLGDIVISNGSGWELSPLSQSGSSSVDKDASNMVGVNFDLIANYLAATTMIDGTDPDLALIENIGIPGGTFGMPSNKVGLVYSDASGGVPAVSDLANSGLAFNRADLKLYGRDASDTVRNLIAIPNFSELGMYSANDLTINNDRLLKARSSVSAGAIDATQWHDITPGVSEYNASAVYMQDELVSWAGDIYRCLADDTGPEAFTPSNWSVIDAESNRISNGTSKVEIAAEDGAIDFEINGVERAVLDNELTLNQSSALDGGLNFRSSIASSNGIPGQTDLYHSIHINDVTGGVEAFTGSPANVGYRHTVRSNGSPTGDGAFLINAVRNDLGAGALMLPASKVLSVWNNATTELMSLRASGNLNIAAELYTNGTSLQQRLDAVAGSGNLISNGTSKVEIATEDGPATTTIGGDSIMSVLSTGITFQKNLVIQSATTYDTTRYRTGSAHPFTAIAPASMYGAVGALSTSNGGIFYRGFSGGSGAAYAVLGYGQSPTTNGTQGIFQFIGRKSDGATSSAPLASGEDLFSVTNYSTNAFLVKGNGDLQIAGELFTDGTSLQARLDAISGGSGNLISNGTSKVEVTATNGPVYTTVNNQQVGRIFAGGTFEYIQRSLGNFVTKLLGDASFATPHPFTALSTSDIYKSEYIPAEGGIRTRYFSSGTAAAMETIGHQQTATTNGVGGVFRFNGSKSDGGTNAQSLTNAEDLFVLLNNGSAALGIKGNGSLYTRGQIVNYQTASNENLFVARSGFATAHPFSGLVSADVFKTDVILNYGGLRQSYFADAGYAGFHVNAYSEAPNAYGCALFNCLQSNGSTSTEAVSDARRMFVIMNSSSEKMALYGNGDLKVSGQVTGVTKRKFISASTYTTVAGDESKMLQFSNACVVTIDEAAHPEGAILNFLHWAGETDEVTIGLSNPILLGVRDGLTPTMNGPYSVATAYKVASDAWTLFGDLEA